MKKVILILVVLLSLSFYIEATTWFPVEKHVQYVKTKMNTKKLAVMAAIFFSGPQNTSMYIGL